MAEVLKAKREQAERLLEESKQANSGPESVEARKARLLAQRDALREAKKKQMAQELADFNAKTTTKDNLYDELKRIDEQKKHPVNTTAEQAELDKRRAILKGVKQQIDLGEKEDALKKAQTTAKDD